LREGLDHVVVGAGAEAVEAIVLGAACGKEENPDLS
jgi:hypothetical protein